MAGRIHLLGESRLIAMGEAAYDSETLLQKLLADHPDLLAGDQIDAEEPRRWLLVSREMAVPGEHDGAGGRSLDHLFLDQDAIPTLVEVKRSSGTRIRHEVIGQMLDYAADAVAYRPVEEVRGSPRSRRTSPRWRSGPERSPLAGPAADDVQRAESLSRVVRSPTRLDVESDEPPGAVAIAPDGIRPGGSTERSWPLSRSRRPSPRSPARSVRRG